MQHSHHDLVNGTDDSVLLVHLEDSVLKLQFSLFGHLGAKEAHRIVVVIVAIYTSNKHGQASVFNWSRPVLVSTDS